MKFGQIQADTYLFKQLPKTRFWVQNLNNEGHIYVGSTNWTEAYWKGLIYPPKTKSTEYLYHFSRFFNSIELNTTFYRNPTIEQVIKWKQSTPADFVFCPKVPSRISQSKLLGLESELWQDFNEAISHFEQQLGPIFLQFPDYVDTSRLPQIIKVLHSGLIQFPLLFELRHPSWFKLKNEREELMATLAEKKCGLVITDTSGRQDVLHMDISCPYLLIRFVSYGRAEDDSIRLEHWLNKIIELSENGMKQIHFIFHHPNAGQMIHWSKMMMEKFQILR